MSRFWPLLRKSGLFSSSAPGSGSSLLPVSSLAILTARGGEGAPLLSPGGGCSRSPLPDSFGASSGFGCREEEALTLKICRASSSGLRAPEGVLVSPSMILETYLFLVWGTLLGRS